MISEEEALKLSVMPDKELRIREFIQLSRVRSLMHKLIEISQATPVKQADVDKYDRFLMQAEAMLVALITEKHSRRPNPSVAQTNERGK